MKLAHTTATVHWVPSDHNSPVSDKDEWTIPDNQKGEQTTFENKSMPESLSGAEIETSGPLVHPKRLVSFDRHIRYFLKRMVDQDLLKRRVEQGLSEIRQEAETAYELDSEIDRIEEKAYKDLESLLLSIIDEIDYSLDLPDFGWAEDGSLSVTWFHTEGRATIRVYGDDVAIYSIYFGEKRQLAGVCELSDTCMLFGFIRTLSCIFSQ